MPDRGTHLNIQWHANYLLLGTWPLALAGSLRSACIGLIYWLGSVRQWHFVLTAIHVLTTSCKLVLLTLLGLLYRKLSSSSRGFRRLNRLLKALVYAFLLGQLALLINLMVSQN